MAAGEAGAARMIAGGTAGKDGAARTIAGGTAGKDGAAATIAGGTAGKAGAARTIAAEAFPAPSPGSGPTRSGEAPEPGPGFPFPTFRVPTTSNPCYDPIPMTDQPTPSEHVRAAARNLEELMRDGIGDGVWLDKALGLLWESVGWFERGLVAGETNDDGGCGDG